ncbi:MAG TPA: carboxypeptidase-like regulatory domain-containing protein, partial [Vicinamibacterales bacterium]
MLKRALVVVVSLFLWTPGYGQTLGTITGEIKDSSGASIPGSTVTAQNVATNAVRTQASNNVGAFTFPAMPPGVYLVKAELEGFKPAENRVELHVEQTLRVSFTLELGGITETALVTAVTPLLTTENATVGTVIENRRIVELPLNGRNYLSLIALSPNVSAGFAGAGQAGDRQGGSRANQQISISGQRREFNYYTLDGVDNTDVNFNTYIFLPSVDALEEFKVQTGIYSAEFGRAAGQVNVVTKSGSNAFHGTVFEFHRNDKFDARPYAFTAAQAAAPKPDFGWHQFGYTASGPVARNRLFFMSNWEGYKDDKTFLAPFTVPTVAMRAGDFSAYAGQLLDPATCAVAGGVRSCQPFAGNRIPSNRIAQTSQDLLEFYPEPNAAGTQNNYIAQQDRVIDRKQYTQRMDFIQSTNALWMGRYSWSHDDEVTPALKLNGSKLLNTVHQGMIGNTYTISPTVLNEARFGFNSFFNTFGRELAFVRDVVTELGIPGISTGPPESWGIPAVGITGFSGFGDSTEGPYTNRNKVFEFTDNLSWFRGNHSFKLGGTLRFDQYNQVGNQFSRGSFTFDGRATGSATGAATSGAPAFADFLLGTMRTAESAVALATTNFRAASQAYYFTDTWRMREDMTLDLGIRYEYVPPWLDKGGTLINAYLPYNDTGLPVADLSRHPVLVRIGEGDFYEDSPIRFAPNIQTSRDGR